MDASSKAGGWPRLVVAGGKSKLPDLPARQCTDTLRLAYKGVHVEVRDGLTMVGKANGCVIERQAWTS